MRQYTLPWVLDRLCGKYALSQSSLPVILVEGVGEVGMRAVYLLALQSSLRVLQTITLQGLRSIRQATAGSVMTGQLKDTHRMTDEPDRCVWIHECDIVVQVLSQVSNIRIHILIPDDSLCRQSRKRSPSQPRLPNKSARTCNLQPSNRTLVTTRNRLGHSNTRIKDCPGCNLSLGYLTTE